jgi:hypothetical protein
VVAVELRWPAALRLITFLELLPFTPEHVSVHLNNDKLFTYCLKDGVHASKEPL